MGEIKKRSWREIVDFLVKKSWFSGKWQKIKECLIKERKRNIFLAFLLIEFFLISFLVVELFFWDFLVSVFKVFIIFQAIEIWKLLAGIGVALSLFVAFKRLKIADKNLENETKQIASDQFSRQNQQFLDAIKIFDESKTLESKKGALFHLENLALSSPAHRQRVLDFLNSLNGWMREHQKELENVSFFFIYWKNEKKLLLEESIVSRETQLLSAEIPKIYENIIRKHNEEFSSFSEEEKTKYSLDFSYFVFADIDFMNFIFPEGETQFVSCVFFGNANFVGVIFSGSVDFYGVQFSGDADFWEVKFSGDANFCNAKFFENSDFQEANFSGCTNFQEVEFSGDSYFQEARFSRNASFRNAKFSGNAYFQGVDFFKYLSAKEADFQKCPIKTKKYYEKSDDFLSLENFKKFQSAGALFSDEQIAYFENLEKTTPSN